MTTIDPTTLAKAREWVEKDFVTEAHFRAAAEVIAALPDEWIDAEKLAGQAAQLRALYNAIEHTSVDKVNDLFFRALVSTIGAHVEMLEALFPAPQPRTLADMTREEREACQWAQADFDDGIAERPIRVVITTTGKATADIVLPDGNVYCVHAGKLAPFPDLPRMVWPGEQATEEDMSIIPPKIDTSTGHDDYVDMTPEDVPEGEAWIVTYLGEEWVGTRASHDEVWSLARMDGEACRYADGCRVTLVSRLVPEEQA